MLLEDQVALLGCGCSEGLSLLDVSDDQSNQAVRHSKDHEHRISTLRLPLENYLISLSFNFLMYETTM